MWCNRCCARSMCTSVIRARRGSGNCILPTDIGRFEMQKRKEFSRMWLKKFGVDMGVGQMVLLLSTKKVTPHRQLDDKKRKQLSIIFGEKLMYAIGDNEELSRLDLSFAKIDIEKDMSAIKVHWLARGDREDEHISQQLENAANGLRTILKQHFQHALVPPIRFIADTRTLQLDHMNKLFAAADYGVDYRALSETAAALGKVVDDEENERRLPAWMRQVRIYKRNLRDQMPTIDDNHESSSSS